MPDTKDHQIEQARLRIAYLEGVCESWKLASKLQQERIAQLEAVVEAVRQWAESYGGPHKTYDSYASGEQDGANTVLDILEALEKAG